MNILQNDENFFVAITEYEGKPAILKRLQSSTPEQRQRIFKNEQLGMAQFKKLAREHPEWRLVVPEVYSSTDNEMVRELIEGEELFNDGLSEDVTSERLQRLAGLLAEIDAIEPDLSSDDALDNSAPYKNIRQRFDVWSKMPLETKLLSDEEYAAANALISDYEAELTPRYAHGDMSPYKHVFIMKEDNLGLIDFEHYSAYKPRFYDICYAYSRLFTLAEDTNAAKTLLQGFIRKATKFSEHQLLAVMTQRAIGMHFDALNDYKKGKDYRGRAKELLGLCLRRDVDALLQ
jgi:aminoglycoside phosphotransferase (APT) family kinase protein